jgi:tRNA (Thr-GGU) A37 N-methylase
VTIVEVLKIDGNTVWVRGLDAWPGTPILDLKPEIKEER